MVFTNIITGPGLPCVTCWPIESLRKTAQECDEGTHRADRFKCLFNNRLVRHIEQKFEGLLQGLQPRREYLRLFEAVIRASCDHIPV